ncbi:MAG: helicase C-terminal domain-containing protein [Anaerolineae bacterium]
MSRIYVALDIETTGLKAERDAIIEIGAVKFRDDQVLETWSSLVNPGRPLPYKIQLLTGITNEELASAPPLFALSEPLTRFVRDYPIVGHNISFDLKFLNQYGIALANHAVDTFELASTIMPHASRYSLATLAEELGIEFPEQHRALADAMATKDLFLALFQRACQLDPKVIEEINFMAAGSDWSLRHVFRDAARTAARSAFTGSIGQQLLAKREGQDELLGLMFTPLSDERPLKPSPEFKPLDLSSLTNMLEEGSLLAQHFPGYEYRPQQVKMLQAVAEAFNQGKHLLVEAGTGIGKSLAYLLPAIHFAVANGQPVVVSTNTINLQDQLFHKDIPDLQKILPLEFQCVLLKGRSNYICRRRLELLKRSGALSTEDVRVLAKILVWLPTTATGDKAELTLVKGQDAIWRKVCVEVESCRPESCSYNHQGTCFFYRARERAESAHLIVVNHALLLSDMVAENRVLPEHRYLIVDEAHHLEARATEQLAFKTDQWAIHGLLNELSYAGDKNRGFLAGIKNHFRGSSVSEGVQRQIAEHLERTQEQVEEARQAVYQFFDTLALFLEDHGRDSGQYDKRVRLTSSLRVQPAWSNVEIVWDNVNSCLTMISNGLEWLFRGLQELEDHDILDYEDLLMELLSYLGRVREVHEQLNAIISEPVSNGIYWANVAVTDGNITLNSAPLHVGELLRQQLFEPKECAILTSATLRTEGNFDYLRGRLGLWDFEEEVVGSPFDYRSSTLLYIPTDIPEPNTPHYARAIHETLIELCRATAGRTLVLLTSKTQLRQAHAAISEQLAADEIVVLGQYIDGYRHQLLENFKTTEKAVLLGTRSFWEGIDVMGEALSCLVLARLPFPVPDDPVFAARSETFDNPFTEFAVPQTVLRFRQGFGRLIRSKTDRGVVAMLDRRVLTKSYGSAFLNSLPPCTTRQGPVRDLPRLAAQWIDGKVTY